jgi:NADH pyrophosphatase NudC (nudix superfamily)
MTSREQIKKVKRLPVTEEFITMLLENPENYYIKKGVPDGSNYVRMYEDPARACTYIEFQNDEWRAVEEGLKVPSLDVEILERFCQRCDSEMMYDENERKQYCPKCERNFAIQ